MVDRIKTIAVQRLSDFLPEVSFDVSQNAGRERQKETEAAYKLVVINNVLNDVLTQTLAKVFDFEEMTLKDGAIGETFVKYLERVQVNLTPELRIILTACNYKLSNCKTKKEQQLDRNLLRQEDIELRDLKVRVAIKCVQYEDKIKKATKNSKKEELHEEDSDGIEDLINSSPAKEHYIIFEEIGFEYMYSEMRISILNKAKEASFEIQLKEPV